MTTTVDIAAQMARRRDELWLVVLRAKCLCFESDRLCRRSRWEARRARRLIERRVLRGLVTQPPAHARRPRRPTSRRRLRAVH
jgi:hypothetical protein